MFYHALLLSFSMNAKDTTIQAITPARRHRRKNSNHQLLKPTLPATNLKPQALQNVTENHAFEQFFWDVPTTHKIRNKCMNKFKNPLLLATPSLAIAAQQVNQNYLLLEKDRRFHFLNFRYFDLHQPKPVTDYEFDAVFCDPPFANLDLCSLKVSLDMLGCGDSKAGVPLFLAYNSRREDELFDIFEEYKLRREWCLGYLSVRERTQRHLYLYTSEIARNQLL